MFHRMSLFCATLGSVHFSQISQSLVCSFNSFALYIYSMSSLVCNFFLQMSLLSFFNPGALKSLYCVVKTVLLNRLNCETFYRKTHLLLPISARQLVGTGTLPLPNLFILQNWAKIVDLGQKCAHQHTFK